MLVQQQPHPQPHKIRRHDVHILTVALTQVQQVQPCCQVNVIVVVVVITTATTRRATR